MKDAGKEKLGTALKTDLARTHLGHVAARVVTFKFDHCLTGADFTLHKSRFASLFIPEL